METIRKYHLHMFDNTQTTYSENLSDEMKVFYSKYLITYAEPELYHDQFGQQHDIPKNGGKDIEFRKYSPLAKAMTPLTEGVTPAGNSLKVSTITSRVAQYGDYIELSDMLLLTAIDNNMLQATELLGSQAGRTSDEITKRVLGAGTNVLYAGGKTSRAALTASDKLTSTEIRNAVRILRKFNAKPFADGCYVAIISPDTAYDLMSDTMWVDVAKYVNPENMYKGEIGKLYGVRFVETTEALQFKGAGAAGIDVNGTLVIAQNAYGTTKIDGGGLEHFVKQLGSSGAADPLNQRATVGWKLTKTAEILVNEYMVRIESGSTFSGEGDWESTLTWDGHTDSVGPSVSVEDMSVAASSTKALAVRTVPAGAKVTFTSATTAKATVDENGVVTGVASGTSVITAKINIEGVEYSDTCTVTVTS